MLDKDLDHLLRNLQAKKITKYQKSYSFSKTLNDVLRKGLK